MPFTELVKTTYTTSSLPAVPDDGVCLTTRVYKPRGGRHEVLRLEIGAKVIRMLKWVVPQPVTVLWGSGNHAGQVRIAPKNGPGTWLCEPAKARGKQLAPDHWALTLANMPCNVPEANLKRLRVEHVASENSLLITLPASIKPRLEVKRA